VEQKNCFEIFHAQVLHYLSHGESDKKTPSWETHPIF